LSTKAATKGIMRSTAGLTLFVRSLRQNQNCLRTGGHQVFHLTQRHTFSVDHIQPKQVDPIVFIGACRWKTRSWHKNASTFQRFGLVSIGHIQRARHHGVGMFLGFLNLQQNGLGGSGRICTAAAFRLGDLLPPTFRSEGSKYHRLDEKSASGEALWGKTLNQPLIPQASAMRPTSMASAGISADSKWGSTTKP
jgi:hypothetical protein